MANVFRDIKHYGDNSSDSRPVVCLHGMGGGTEFAEQIAERWGIHAICPIAGGEGSGWLTKTEMFQLALPEGDAQEKVLEIFDAIAELLEDTGAEWIVGHSQGACLVGEGAGTGAWHGLKGAAMSCGAMPGVAFEPERYDVVQWPRMFLGWHARDPVFRKILGSTKIIKLTRDFLQDVGAPLTTKSDLRRSHAPIWHDHAIIEEMNL